MPRSWLFPAPELLSGLEALLVLCRLRAILRGHLRLQRWQGEP